MFSLKHAFDLCSGLCLLLLGLLLAGLTVPLNAGAQTSQAANYNPRQLDTQKIMGAFQQNYDDLTLVSAHRGIHALAQLKSSSICTGELVRSHRMGRKRGLRSH